MPFKVVKPFKDYPMGSILRGSRHSGRIKCGLHFKQLVEVSDDDAIAAEASIIEAKQALDETIAEVVADVPEPEAAPDPPKKAPAKKKSS